MIKNLFKYSLSLFLTIAVLAVICEGYLRYISAIDLRLASSDYTVFRNGKDAFSRVRGWRYAYSSTRVSNENAFVLETSDDDGDRPTPFVAEPRSGSALLGCSYSFGIGVADHETYLWEIAENFPEIQFENKACPGYGTVQCRALLEELLNKSENRRTNSVHYDKIFYGLMLDHLNRNAELRWNEERGNYNIFPWAEYKSGNVIYHEPGVVWWPGSDRFKSIIFFRNLYLNYMEAKMYPRIDWINMCPISDTAMPIDDRIEGLINYKKRLFNGILAEMLELAKNYGAEFYVLFLERNAEDLIDPNLKASGLHTLDISFPFQMKEEYYVMPNCGGHPNAKVHKAWADAFVKQMKDKF